MRRRGTGSSELLFAVALLATSFNLRGAVSSVGPVLREMQLDLGMSDGVAGLLTALPTIAFGAVGLVSARAGRRWGTERAMTFSSGLLAVGLAVRVMVPSIPVLLIASLAALVGIAIMNVLVPVVIKAWYPRSVGAMTGWYSWALSLGVAVPAAATLPIAETFGGWQAGLGFWAIPAVIALVPWVAVRRRGSGPAGAGTGQASNDGPPAPPAPTATPTDPGGPAPLRPPIHRQARAWGLTVFFGLQSLEAYTTMGWLPSILRDAGVTPATAGVLLAVTMGLGAPISLLIPRLAARSPDQRPWVVGLTAASAAAYTGLILAPASAPWLWSVLLGIGLGAFPLAVVLIGLRASTTAGTIALSSLVQGVGYLLAALGPVTIGLVREATGDWVLPLLILAALLVPKLLGGLVAAAPGTVDEP